ncbi:MAG TPA: M48 family metallopeptidase [Dehalococcoidia bacterium]|nr:M48 family metallopeptidase [Dehalococcoidia bacterium]
MSAEYQQPVLIYDRIASNRRRTFILMAAFFVIVAGAATAVGIVAGLPPGLAPIVIVFVAAFVVFSYFGSDTVALNVAGAHQVGEEQERDLYRLVENLCIGSGLPMPKVYVIEDGSMNAFATGRDPDHASIAVTRGIMNKLERREMEGVLAHELSHIGNRDTLVMGTVVVLIGLLALLADIGLRLTWFGAGTRRSYSGKNSKGSGLIVIVALVFVILSPIIARLIAMAVSRQREYLADASGALLTRYPEGLASALEKISGDTDPLDQATKATEHLYFVNPLSPHKSAINNMFSSHPPIEDRIKLLRAM